MRQFSGFIPISERQNPEAEKKKDKAGSLISKPKIEEKAVNFKTN